MSKQSEPKTWWSSWIGMIVGFLTICSAILGALTWQYSTFATEEEILAVKETTKQTIEQLSEKTIKGFKEINKTNQQLQLSIMRFDLQDRYNQLVDHKYKIIRLLESNPNNVELKKDLEKCKNELHIVEVELNKIVGK